MLSTLFILLSQERLKKIKSEYGKVQLGNINVDMVRVCLAFFFSPLSSNSADALVKKIWLN